MTEEQWELLYTVLSNIDSNLNQLLAEAEDIKRNTDRLEAIEERLVAIDMNTS